MERLRARHFGLGKREEFEGAVTTHTTICRSFSLMEWDDFLTRGLNHQLPTCPMYSLSAGLQPKLNDFFSRLRLVVRLDGDGGLHIDPV
jgi:hypothetical protein